MINKKYLIIMNIGVLIICAAFTYFMIFIQHKDYEYMFLSQVGYLYTDKSSGVEDYFNQNFAEDNDYYQHGKEIIIQSSYQKNYQYFINEHLKDSDRNRVFIGISIYLFITSLMILYNYHFKKYQKLINDNIYNTENQLPITITYPLNISFQKHQQYIQYQIDKITKEKEFMYQFIMDVTHQLKTPLSSLQLMIENQKYEKQLDASKLENQIQKMNTIMTQLLNQGKLQAGKIEMHIEKNCFEELIDDMMSDLDELLYSYQIELEVECLADIGYYDSYWLKEAIENIIKNCIEHSKPQQSIELKVKKDSQINISIRDYAGGIADLNHLFERYYTTDYVKGVGLGLYLSHLIISKHFGELKVENIESGTLFIINIPDQLIM
ncbi:sensor histidine kinase [Candidatus Stoquefichus massiliensis]|uniref:sensor histidine kinase n=1 Tax=Candidatus Stoquefichus massiliensis TaxID=1470350 RepID=UPI00164E5E64|nr:HAMP domain-containing sensor histidine kinase [Candidatus Stoquefichus massiliensis]